jgi:DNA-3-methyladenine glycosylase II
MSRSSDGRDVAAREHLRRADPVIAGLIDAYPDFDPRAWLKELPPMDAYGALLFQVVGQQLSLAATRAILDRVAQLFDGRLPTPRQLLDREPQELHRSGLSRRKVETLRALAVRFRDGRLSGEKLARLTDAEIESVLTEVPGVGPWTVHGFLIIALNRPDVLLPGDVALRRAVRQSYGLDHMPDEQELLHLAERWRPYRTLAVGYLFASLFDEANRARARARSR